MLDVLLKLFSNPAFTGFAGAAVGACVTICVSLFTFLNQRKANALAEERMLLEVAIQEHANKTKLALDVAKAENKRVVLYPAITSVIHFQNILKIIRQNSSPEKTLAGLREAWAQEQLLFEELERMRKEKK
jgi:hypothetical protein